MDARYRYFLVGCVIGFLSSTALWQSEVPAHPHSQTDNIEQSKRTPNTLKTTDRSLGSSLQTHNASGEHTVAEDTSVADELYARVRILCWVMTSPANLNTKAAQVKATWGRRCNILLFMSSAENKTFPAINVQVQEGRGHLTGKTMHSLKYIFDHHLDDADWFLKADDDTYVVVENLRYMLAEKDPNEPVYYGHHFKVIVKPDGYMSGGAGYVFSRETLKRYGTRGHHRRGLCREDGGAEDVAVGQCLHNLGVLVSNSLDSDGRSRFHCFTPGGHIHGAYPGWYLKFDAHGATLGMAALSNYTVSFHYIGPKDMWNVDNFIYRFKPYGNNFSPKIKYHNFYVQRG